MIRPDVLGELKDGAAGLVALSELLASRRVGPKAIAGALPSAGEACETTIRSLTIAASDVLDCGGDDVTTRTEMHAIFDRAEASLRALEALITNAGDTPGDAKTRLAVERAAVLACANVGTSLFVAELFSFTTAPRVVSIRVADVLGFVPPIPEGPGVIRATLEVPPGPVATTDARLLRALVELGVQIVDAAGVTSPHIHVVSADPDGARVRIGPSPTPMPPSSRAAPPSRRSSARPPPPIVTLSVRRLPWVGSAQAILRAAATKAGADVVLDPHGRGVTIGF